MSLTSYAAPRSLGEALRALGELGDAVTVVAGGQDVVPLMNQGRLAPSHLLDISRLAPLASVTSTGARGGTLRIGSLVTHAALARDPAVREAAPLLAEAAERIGGGLQVRNRGTIGGAAAAANPAYDLPACLAALDAVCILGSLRETRRVPARSFFLGAGRTARRANELLLGFDIPRMPPRAGWAYAKLKFSEGGYTIAGAACLLTRAADGRCERVSVVLSGVTESPLPLPTIAERLAGQALTTHLIEAAAGAASAAVERPIKDAMAGGEYRRAMAGVMVVEALAQAARRARGGEGA